MKTENALPGGTVYGLLVIALLVVAAVEGTAPPVKNAAGHELLFRAHEGILYFIQAEEKAKQALPEPSLHWSQPVLDPDTACDPLGNGVWMAHGTLSGAADRVPQPPNWAVLFVPETGEVLLLRVGSHAMGDVRAALRRAGLDPARVQGVRF